MKEFIVEIILVVVLLALSAGIVDIYWMPMGMQFLLLLVLITLFGAFSIFLWREKGGDEREQVLIQKSDRVGFLIGAFILLLAIVFEGAMYHMVDPWMTGALAAMVAAKMLGYIYFQKKH